MALVINHGGNKMENQNYDRHIIEQWVELLWI